MELITKRQRAQLIANGIEAERIRTLDSDEHYDPIPVVKLFTPDGACTWLLTDLSPDDEDCAYGLCDLGFGFPEFGPVLLSDLRAVRGKLGLPVERDRYVTLDKPLSHYMTEARSAKRIQV